MVMKNIYKDSEHPFAQYVRILGKGKSGSRSLSFEEAQTAFGMILTGDVLDAQLGAFLMLLRVKEESPQELAGFVNATREWLNAPCIDVDLDWSSYAGKRKHYPWFLLAALILAENGVRVFMHGASGHTINRLYTEDVLPLLGHNVCRTWQDVQAHLEQSYFAYLPLEAFCPPLANMIQLRNVLGLRSPVHTLSRLINPLNAKCSLQAIFHPAYRESHQQAAQILNYANTMVIKGEGGEFERNPDGRCLVKGIKNNELYDLEWPMMFEERHQAEDAFELNEFLAVWRGSATHQYGEAAVVGTLALALIGLQKATEPEAALAMAQKWWKHRKSAKKRVAGEQIDMFD
ncbi:MAG: glycosyl transferase family protein [Moraxellaceae bacterium]|nr:glycosyl transferase family protein [Pseudomonadales bacterium]MCP5174105.1 glycosyl transferase family protein [Moraxellaceae bacterium]MCP5176309.1 glycosyl transferase family protein [Moraxellaceae bacterium]HQV21774.1 glycosyl transferase family protein [Agitococcus sp.]